MLHQLIANSKQRLQVIAGIQLYDDRCQLVTMKRRNCIIQITPQLLNLLIAERRRDMNMSIVSYCSSYY